MKKNQILFKQGRHATNDASIMCSNSGAGYGGGSVSGGVDDIVAKGHQYVLKQ